MNRQHFDYKTYSPDGYRCVNNICSRPVTIQSMMQRTPVSSPAPATITGQYTLYHFMDRWTSSSCWRLAKALGQMQEWLAVHGVSVVLVGQSHYFQQANRLAKELHLPFRLVNDKHGSLQRLYGFGDCVSGSNQQTLVLVDTKGRVRYLNQAQVSGISHQVGRLRTAVEYLSTR